MKYLLLLFSLTATGLQAQEISYSPTSFHFWGGTKEAQKVDIRYKFIQYSFIDIRSPEYDKKGDTIDQFNHGLFIAPRINKNGFYASGGVGYFVKKLANHNGTHFNFLFEAGYHYKWLGIKYAHISNGGTGKVNLGMDNVSFVIRI